MRREKVVFSIWLVACSLVVLSLSLETIGTRLGIDPMVSLSERSIVRLGSPPALELGDIVIIREKVAGANLYEIEEGKYSIDFQLNEKFSRVYWSGRERMKVSHSGNMYESGWDDFTSESEVIAVITSEEAGSKTYFILKLRAPDIIENGKILQMRVARCTYDEAATLIGQLGIKDVKELKVENFTLNVIDLAFMP